MSAALQLPMIWGASNSRPALQQNRRTQDRTPASSPAAAPETKAAAAVSDPVVSFAFYRKHTESLLRRYLYASMQVGRAPSILSDPVARGWASSRPIRSFEDAVIFVLDIERCLDQLGSLDRQMLSRIVLQEYTQAETAVMLGMSVRAICYKYPAAVDRLTGLLLEAGLLVLPH